MRYSPGSQTNRRTATILVGVFSALALLLAVFGVYSVITQAVIQRRYELGIRCALGADPGGLIRLAMRTRFTRAHRSCDRHSRGNRRYTRHAIGAVSASRYSLDHAGRDVARRS